jgi:adenosine deaminase
MKAMERLVAALPKAELHVHLEGTLEPEMTFHLARKHKVKLRFSNAGALREAYQFKDLQCFLDLYYEGAGVLRDREDFHVLTAAYLEKAVRDGIWHVEPFFDPQTHTARGITMKEVVEGIVGALKEGEKKHGITWRLIPCFLRHLSEADAMKTFQEMLPYREYFTAVGLDSSEKGNPPAKFERVFAQVRDAGLKVVAHAGEEGPASSIREALEKLQAVRIDHGVRCVEDAELVQELARKQIPLTTCPLSNVRLCVYSDLGKHPLKLLLDAGVSVTANSDDPPYFGGYLLDNWMACARELHLEEKHLVQLAKNSFSGSFLSQKEKEQWIAKIDRVVSSLGGGGRS